MSYAGKVQDRISLCQTLRIRASSGLALVQRPNGVRTDRRQYTQAAGTRPRVSGCFKRRTRSCCLALRTMIHLAPLLRTLICASGSGQRLRLLFLPFTCSIAFHRFGAYASRVSIGLRRRAVVLRTEGRLRGWGLVPLSLHRYLVLRSRKSEGSKQCSPLFPSRSWLFLGSCCQLLGH
jgi:hypothetical protein